MNFSLGPWVSIRSNQYGLYIRQRANDIAIAHVHRHGDVEREDADARLMAAAPDMYEALLAVVNGDADSRARALQALGKIGYGGVQ